jgi:thioredoxin 1
MAGLVAVTEDRFWTEVLNSPSAVLVQFWAPWSGPCRQLRVLLAGLAAEGFRILTVNVDDEAALAVAHQITAVPTLLVFRNGQVSERVIGLQPEQGVRQLLAD